MFIFLDSNVFHNDAFLNYQSNKKLVQLAKLKKIKLYISCVVLMEVKNNYEKQLRQYNKSITDINSKINRLKQLNLKAYEEIEIEAELVKFDKYYENLEKQKIINIIEAPNTLLPELIFRSINRIKPFSESKQEFRDAIIWLTYARLAEEKGLNNCFFITDNFRDFCRDEASSERKNNEKRIVGQQWDVHPDLSEDSKRFKILQSSMDVFVLEGIRDDQSIELEVELINHITKNWKRFFNTQIIEEEVANDVSLRLGSFDGEEIFLDDVGLTLSLERESIEIKLIGVEVTNIRTVSEIKVLEGTLKVELINEENYFLRGEIITTKTKTEYIGLNFEADLDSENSSITSIEFYDAEFLD